MIVACDGCSDATAARARAAGADLVLELPRGGKVRAQDAAVERARGEIVAFSDANAPGSPTRCARWSAPSPIRASATPAGRCASCRPPRAPGRQPGGRLLALRDGGARARVAPVLDHRRQRRDLRDPPRGLHRRRPDHGPRPLASRSTWSSAAGARSTCPSARASEKMVPSLERRVRAQAADDEPHLADRPARRHALPARLPAGLRADDPLPPRAALRHARACTRSRSPRTSRSWRSRGARRALYVATLALQLALLAAAAARPARCARARCSSRATTCSPPPRSPPACGTGCATARAPLGGRRGDALTRAPTADRGR